MEISPCCNSVTGHQIATNFCTYHHSTAVVPCTKFCSDHCIGIEMRAKRHFHRIWIAMEKRQWNGALFMPNVYIQLQWLLMSQQHEEPGDEWLNFTAFLGTADREVHIIHKSHKHEEPGHQQPWYHSGPVFYLCLRTVLDSKNLVLLLAKIILFSVPVLATRS